MRLWVILCFISVRGVVSRLDVEVLFNLRVVAIGLKDLRQYSKLDLCFYVISLATWFNIIDV